MRVVLASVLVLGAAALAAPAFAAPGIETHDVTVRLVPAESALDAEDRMLVRRDGGGTLRFELNGGLEIVAATVDGKPAVPEQAGTPDAGSRTWQLAVPAGASERAEVIVSYRGTIADTARDGEGPPATPAHGRIGGEGAYLSAASRWVPSDGSLCRFTVRTRPVPGWEFVTQGTRTAPAATDAPDAPTLWRGKFDADGVTLAAGPWKVLRKQVGDVEIGAYLSAADATGADALVAHVAAGLRRCGRVFSPYAFDRLDVVECPQGVAPPTSSGRGTPEFVLVGADALRSALAARTKTGAFPAGWLDREIVHGWWGNLVLADTATGDWCEALATYCTDDWADERAGGDAGPAAAAERRRAASLRFARQVDAASEVPLRKVTGLNGAADDSAAAAILRGKGAMFFHALRREIGDEAFWGALRRVARERRGRRMTWDDWRIEFERSAKRGLAEVFAQALDRTGAPRIELVQTRTRADGGRFRVTGVLRQVLAPGEAPWRISVPLVVEHLEGTEETILDVSGAETAFALVSPSLPLRILADPQFHVLRALDREAPAAAGPSRTVRFLLPDVKSATSPERAQRTVAALSAPAMEGRLAGSPAEAKARALVLDELRLCGIEPEERPFSFAVKRIDPARPVLVRVGGAAVEGVVPLVASPATGGGDGGGGGVSIVGSVEGDDADLAGRALVVDLGAGAEKPLAFLRDVAKLAVARKAAALFVRLPADPPPSVAELFAFPETLHRDVAARLAAAGAQGGDPDPLRHAARVAARIGSDVELPLPVVAVPHGFAAAKDEILRLDVTFTRTVVRSANVVALLRARGTRHAGTVVLGAALDAVGAGAPDAVAGDGASGVAALIEAVNVLAAQDDLLARDVWICCFGAEAWGLRGSRAFVAELPEGHDVVAMVGAGAVGGRAEGGVSVVGTSMHARLGRAVATAIEQSALDVGRDLDRTAFAEGGDAWPFHRRGIPAVDLHTVGADAGADAGPNGGTDAATVARIGRVLALAALAVAGGW